MENSDRDPPLLRGFTRSKSGPGRALTSPTTSIWLAIIFMALFFALLSIQRNVKRANDAVNPPKTKFSGWIVDAPEFEPEKIPPPNPDSVLNQEEMEEILVEQGIEFELDTDPLEIKPIDVDLQIQMPEDYQSQPAE